MKKFLSLVLALVMTMSLVTISAGAKDFTDASKVTYKEAVDVVSAVKIVDGYADGSFNPNATLTRGAAAKIICNMILGPTTASALAADAAPYKDVPANSTFAGYIAFCAKEGIISGYADGTFRPGNTLTGYAFMKMLLGALGYDKSIEGYEGANWSINVAKRALAIGLDSGLADDFVGTKPVTREEACLYALNTLEATMVEYENNSSITVGNVVINTNSKAKNQTWTKDEGTDYENNGVDSTAGQTKEFCEVYFKDLKQSATDYDAFGAPSTTWYVKSTKVGEYVDAPKKTYTEKVKAKDIYADLKMSEDANGTTHYVDGVKQSSPAAITATNDTKYGTQGTILDVYYKSSDNKVTIVEKHVYLAKITSIDEATKTTKRTVNLSGIGASSVTMVGTNGADSFETEDFARKDYVVFTAAGDNHTSSSYSVKTMAAAQKVTGEFTAYSGTGKITVGGTEYKIGNEAAHNGTTYGGTLKDIVDLFLDTNGYVMEIETSEAADASYAYVVNAGNRSGGVINDWVAELLFVDGTKKIVETDIDYSGLRYDFVTFRVNSDDKYVLTDARSGNNGGTDANVLITNGASEMTVNGDNHIYGNDSTIYLVATTANSKTVYTAYTGYKNVPTMDNGTTNTPIATTSDYVCKAGTVANYVFIDATTGSGVRVVGGTNDVIFVLADGEASKTKNSDSYYYTLKAVVNGEITEIKLDVADTTAANFVTGNPAVSKIFSGRTVDKYGVSTMGTITGSAATGIDEISKGTVSMDWNAITKVFDTTLALAKDCNVFFVNKDSKILAWDVDSVAYDTNDLVYYTTDKGAVNNLFIVSK